MKKILFALAALTAAGKVQAITLDEVTTAVKATHPAIRRAQWDAKEAGARRGEAWLPDPKVGIEFQEIPRGNVGLKNADMINYSVSQEIPFPGALISKSKALNAEYKARQSLVTSAEREEIFKAKEAFYKLVAVENQLKNKKWVLESYRNLSGSVKTGYLVGKEAFSGLAMFQIKRGETEAEIFDLQHQQEAGIAALNYLMGRKAHDPLVVAATPVKKLKVPMEVLESRLNQNSDLSALQWMARKAKKEIGVAQAGLIPTLEPEFMFNQRRNMEDAYTLKLSMNVPLWLNRNASEIKAARAAYRSSLAEYEDAALTTGTQLHYLIHHASEHYKIVMKYQNEILPLAHSSMKAALDSYGTGRINPSELLLVVMEYQTASEDYWENWEDYQMEYALLEQLVGEDL